jgi:hypothetical protein
MTTHRQLEPAGPGSSSPRGSYSKTCGDGLGGMKMRSNRGHDTHIVLAPLACSPMNSRFSGRWDRNRTCTLRFWSLLPVVQQRSGKYTSRLEIAHFVSPKYVEVHQSSPALGSKLGSTTSPKIVSEMLGHSSVAITLDIYSHVVPACSSSLPTQWMRHFASIWYPEDLCGTGLMRLVISAESAAQRARSAHGAGVCAGVDSMSSRALNGTMRLVAVSAEWPSRWTCTLDDPCHRRRAESL